MNNMIITIENIFGTYTVSVFDDNLRTLESERWLNLPTGHRMLNHYSAKYPKAVIRKKSGNNLSLYNF